MDPLMAKKIIYGILFATFSGLILFSSFRSGADHSAAGGRIVGWLNDVFFYGRLSEYEKNAIVGVGAKFLGHFSLFLGAGLFGFLWLSQFDIGEKKRLLIVLGYGLLLSFLGEFIQLFSEGRFATPGDSLIDFSGFCFTIILTKIKCP